MYISWNDFNVGSANIFGSRSTDNGLTWSSRDNGEHTGYFIRNTQITGDMSGNGTIYIAGMDEGGGGFPHDDTNLIYKSTDGGVFLEQHLHWVTLPGPGVWFFRVTSPGCLATNVCLLAHAGWGEPAAFNNIVHLVYAQHGAGSDAGDVFYIRSTDGGVTFGAPTFQVAPGVSTPPCRCMA